MYEKLKLHALKNENHMATSIPSEVIIAGGGIAGLTTAIALNNIGIRATIFEAAPEIKAVGAGLGLGANAMTAFKRLGIQDEVAKQGKILPFFSILDYKGRLITKTDNEKVSSEYGTDNFAIHRADLHQLLLSKIDSRSIHTDKRIVDINQRQNSIRIEFQDGSSHESEVLISADGIHSQIRKKLLPGSEPRYAGYTCWRAVIENSSLNLTESSETWGPKGRFEQRRLKRTHYIINTSKMIGKLAQIENSFLAGLRNFAFRSIPARVNEKQLHRLYDVDF